MSDQDFFFDEDEKPAEKTAAKTPAKSTPAKSAPAKSGADKPQLKSASTGQQVSLVVASLIAVIALLVGVLGGYVLRGSTTVADQGAVSGATAPGFGTTGGTTGGGTGATGQAPQLTPEQLNSGQMPAGHPNVSGMGGGTGSTETTPSK